MLLDITYSNATHIAIVEVDVGTGTVKVLRYIAVEDCGPMINPMIVGGQVHGGVSLGLGETLSEEIVYDDNGHLLTSSFIDYKIPRSVEMPNIEIQHIETPSPNVLGGFKGMAEGGTIGAIAAISNAVEDALSPFKVQVTGTPLSHENVWRLINQGK
jgi:carbon-monoxide dehydrogenase large subunit